MLKAKVISNVKLPKITLIKELEHVAKNIIIPDMIKGILASKSIKGGKLPKNEDATIRRKKGRNKSLIDTRELLKSFFFKRRDNSSVFISIKEGRKEAGKGLQIDGVGKKKKKYMFFGVSKNANKRAMKFMHNRLRIALNG